MADPVVNEQCNAYAVGVSAPSYVCWSGRGKLDIARLLDLI